MSKRAELELLEMYLGEKMPDGLQNYLVETSIEGSYLIDIVLWVGKILDNFDDRLKKLENEVQS